MNRFALTSIAISIMLVGCASSLPTVTDQDLATAQQNGTLETTYDNYDTLLSQQDLNSPEGAKAKARLTYIGSMLADQREKQIRQDLTQNTLADGLVPLPIINRNIVRLPKMANWDRTRYESLKKELSGDNDKTLARITSQQQALGQLTEYDLAPRLTILDELGTLTADPRYAQEHADSLSGMQAKADAAMKAGQGDAAIKALKALQGVSPNDPAITQELIQANVKLFEKNFWDALAEGRLDDAYTQFMGLSQTSEFTEVMKRLGKSTDDMSSYFLAQAANALANGHLDVAFKLLGQARDIRLKVDPTASDADGPAQQQSFLDAVFARYKIAAANGQVGLAFGYLNAIDAFEPDYQNLHPLLVTTGNQLLGRAVLKVSTAAFTDPNGSTEMGGAVAAGVTKRLFDQIPQDLKIIERDQFDAILREQQIGNANVSANGTPLGTAPQSKDNLVSADYLIEGKLTESRVDTSQEQSKKTMRVVTDTETLTNPDYNTWLTLSDSDRKNYAEPAHTITQDKKEDVTINVQVVRKVGLISASYRLVEARTGRVIATDSETAKDEFTDEGNEGVDLGQFHLPFKLASLPSDTEILQKLTDKISVGIGDKLVTSLANPEVRYMQAAKRFADENDFSDAAEQAANALIMAQQDKQDTKNIRGSLENYSLQVVPTPGGTAASPPVPPS